MLISKFDLYKRGWIELVFDDRNKAYGAYELRQSYSGNLVKAMGITFLTVGLLFGAGIIFKPEPVQIITPTVDSHHVIKLVDAQQQKEIEKPKPPTPLKALKAQPASPPVATQEHLPPVVKIDQDVTKNPVDNKDLTEAIGQIDSKGIHKPYAPPPVEIPGPDAGPVSAATPATVYTTVETMPAPVGGESAWARFLNKNLRYPAPAQEEGVGGKVYMSFIIERDGSLSNITVMTPQGHGFDEEALRVLKLAKAWKPGIQNGQPVRVKFIIPINFQAPENP